MYNILSNFMYWLDSNIFFFYDGIKIPQKSLFLHTFWWNLSLFSVLKERRQLKQENSPLFFEVILCNNADNFFTAR